MSDLVWRFQYHAPDDTKVIVHQEVRAILLTAAEALDRLGLPDCREKSLAITKLEEAMFWANAAIARYPRG